MAGIQDFIQMATQQLGTSEQTAKSATGGLLGLVKNGISGGDFQELLGKIPGADALLKEAPQAASEQQESGGGGLLGGLASAAGSALGGGTGAALNIGSLLSSSGLDLSKAGGFVSLFLGFIKDNAGAGLLEKITSQMPDLKNLSS